MIPEHLTLDDLNAHREGTLMETLGIVYTSIGPNHLSASLQVDSKVYQPMGIMHGGTSLALAETVASAASYLMLDPKTHYCVGLELSANHLRPVTSGIITATARPLHIGKRTHIWEVRIENEKGKLICFAKMTNMVMETVR